MFRSKAFFEVLFRSLRIKTHLRAHVQTASTQLLCSFLKLCSTFTQVLWTCAKVSRRSKRFHNFLRAAAAQLFTTFTRFQHEKSQISDTLSHDFRTLCAIITRKSRKARTKYVLCTCHHNRVTRKLQFCRFLCHCALTSSLLARYSLTSAAHSSRTSFTAPFSDASLLRHCMHTRVTVARF